MVCLLPLAVSAAAITAGGGKPVARLPGNGVYLQLENVTMHIKAGSKLDIERFQGTMVPTHNGSFVSLDDLNSFYLQIEAASLSLSAQSLNALLDNDTLARMKAPLRDLELAFAGHQLVIKGQFHKGIDVPFEVRGDLTPGPGPSIRIHLTGITAAGVIRKGLLDAFGLKLGSIAPMSRNQGLRIEGDDVFLPLAMISPPPRFRGVLTALHVEGDRLFETFGHPADPSLPPPPEPARSYLYFHGGVMQFGKLTMQDVDLQLVSLTPGKSFDFSLQHYYEELLAGYSKSLANKGLLTYVEDYSQLPAHP